MTAMEAPAVQAIVLGALCAAGAGWLLAGPPAGGRLGVGTGASRKAMWSPPARKVPPATSVGGVCAGAVAAVVAGATLLGGSSASRVVTVAVPLVVTGAVAAAAAMWLLRRNGARKAADATRAAVVEACEAIASGLRAGLPPERVLSRTAADLPFLVPVATAARLGADVVPALRSTATRAGAERLSMLASAWEVASRSGAGLADVVSRISTMVRVDAARKRQVDAALGGARATARLFAVLPVLGVALGTGLDADPVRILTATPAGAWCLCTGTSLAAAGLVWVECLADKAAR